PFELIGAPYIDPYELIDTLSKENLPGILFRPTYFQPTFHKHMGRLCGAIQIHVLDRKSFKPVITGTAILNAIYKLYKDKFEWKQPPYEYIEDKLPIDVIFGTDKVRKQIETGTPTDEIEESWKEGVEQFIRGRENYLIYD